VQARLSGHEIVRLALAKAREQRADFSITTFPDIRIYGGKEDHDATRDRTVQWFCEDLLPNTRGSGFFLYVDAKTRLAIFQTDPIRWDLNRPFAGQRGFQSGPLFKWPKLQQLRGISRDQPLWWAAMRN
jgi:hypothetical protein